MGKMGHFKISEHKKVGHFEKKARDRFENDERTENEYVQFWGISITNAYDITWKIHPPHTFWGISSNPPNQQIRAWRKYQFEIPPEGTEFLSLLFFSEVPLFWFNHTFKNNWSTSMNIYTFGALLTLRIQYEYTQTQCEEGASDVNFHLRIPIIIRDLENIIKPGFVSSNSAGR